MDLYGKLSDTIIALRRTQSLIGMFKPNQGEADYPNNTADVAAGRVALGMVHLDPSLQGVPRLYYVGAEGSLRVVVAGYAGWVNVWQGEMGEVHTLVSKHFAGMDMHDSSYKDFGEYVGDLVALGLGTKEVITLADDIFRQEADMHRAAPGNWERVLKVSSRTITIMKANL